MTPEEAQKLREPFPAAAIGQLPKGGVMLDYVGHAAVTDRLLQVDPAWSWEPLALTPEGLPALDRVGNLWIKLTCAGVTRVGVGDGKSAKECIGDAIRNAAMRFGVGLDLWAKEDLQSLHNGNDPSQATQTTPQKATGARRTPTPPKDDALATPEQVEAYSAAVAEAGFDVEIALASLQEPTTAAVIEKAQAELAAIVAARAEPDPSLPFA